MATDEPAGAAAEPPARTALRLLALVGLVYAVAAGTHPGARGDHLAGAVFTVATGVGWVGWLVGRQLDRVGVMAAALCVLAATGGAMLVLTPWGIAVLGVAGLGAATTLELRPAIGVGALGVLAAVVAVAVTQQHVSALSGAVSGAVAGLALGASRRHEAERARQQTLLGVAEQRTALERARAEVLEERNRLAREVHDVLAHTLSALSVQLEALSSLLDEGTDSDEVRASVQRSRGLVVSGLEETRRAVRVLRDEPVAVADQIATLAADADAAFQLYGDSRPVPAAQGVALVRVVQEALTNARKHAAGAEVEVTVRFSAGAVCLTVDNAAPTTASPLAATGSGYGLRGMRERVELLGGTLDAGPHDDGWRVQAELPA